MSIPMPLCGEPPKDPRYTVTIIVQRSDATGLGESEARVVLESVTRDSIMSNSENKAIRNAVLLLEHFIPDADT